MSDLWEAVPAEWQSSLQSVRGEIARLSELLAEEHFNGRSFNPRFDQIFRALEIEPAQVRVVLLGQDPYPDPNFAIGRSFAVPNTVSKLPPSLRNIFVELSSDFGSERTVGNDLQSWSDQGVLLLNKSLTTATGTRNGHIDFGWESITREVVRSVRRINPEVIGILWGADAQTLKDEFVPNRIITAAHPSPLSAHRGFFGSKPFSQVNALLHESGDRPVNW